MRASSIIVLRARPGCERPDGQTQPHHGQRVCDDLGQGLRDALRVIGPMPREAARHAQAVRHQQREEEA
eukprot:CAMPEP_0182540610 /NCGR_PEP_ID=MMETSP1323-20130603/27340_1 /TAXON_ID=236787 /ORGANISM="Florenciella parvula, Strain RCC1693" /LENGTH=68 /DNA_ID=CAMNT_0024751285 /DNA_START=55 /DNA_END=261 /DNA_ORIENTATION=-